MPSSCTTSFTVPAVTWKTASRENQLDMFGRSHLLSTLVAEQFRLLLASLAYTLIEAIRRIALKGTELANAYVGTIRLKLFKIGAVILKIRAVSVSFWPAVVLTRNSTSWPRIDSHPDKPETIKAFAC